MRLATKIAMLVPFVIFATTPAANALCLQTFWEGIWDLDVIVNGSPSNNKELGHWDFKVTPNRDKVTGKWVRPGAADGAGEGPCIELNGAQGLRLILGFSTPWNNLRGTATLDYSSLGQGHHVVRGSWHGTIPGKSAPFSGEWLLTRRDKP